MNHIAISRKRPEVRVPLTAQDAIVSQHKVIMAASSFFLQTFRLYLLLPKQTAPYTQSITYPSPQAKTQQISTQDSKTPQVFINSGLIGAKSTMPALNHQVVDQISKRGLASLNDRVLAHLATRSLSQGAFLGIIVGAVLGVCAIIACLGLILRNR